MIPVTLLQSFFPFLLFFTMSSCYTPVSVSLPPQTFEELTTKQVHIKLKANEMYTFRSASLVPLTIVAPYCTTEKGSIIENVISHVEEVGFRSAVYVKKYGYLFIKGDRDIKVYEFRGKEFTKYVGVIDVGLTEQGKEGCGGALLEGNDEEHLYYFMCGKVGKIETKKAMAGVGTMEEVTGFEGIKGVRGIGYLAVMNYHKVNIYVEEESELKLVHTLGPFFVSNNGEEEKIIDITVSNSSLYILGLSSTIFIYNHTSITTPKSLNFISTVNISLSSLLPATCKNQQIKVHLNNLFVFSIDEGQSFVSEFQINFNATKIEVYLIRYFKGVNNVRMIDIYLDKLMIVFESGVNLYDINVDPRVIDRMMNGIANWHLDGIVAMMPLADQFFIKTIANKSSIISFSLQHPGLKCHCPDSTTESPPPVLIPQPCPEQVHNFTHTCHFKLNFSLEFYEESNPHHILAIVSVFIFCTVIVGILIIWRKNKMDIVEVIVEEVNRLRNKRKEENVEFVEESPAKVSKWDEIREYGIEEEIDGNGFDASKESSITDKIEEQIVQSTERQLN